MRSRLIAMALTGLVATTAQAWTMKQAPLMTRWAKDVSPTNALPDYPRPQLVRADWMNLNGLWQFQPGKADEPVPVGRPLSGDILVPFAPESALSGVMEHHDRLWYRRTFTVPQAWAGKRVILHFDSVDYESQAFVNGNSLGTHLGGYDRFSYDITANLHSGENELILRVFDPTEAGGQPRGKQTTHGQGIMYTPTTGIWKTVWLEPVDATAAINEIHITPNIDDSTLHLTLETSNATSTVHVSASSNGKEVAVADGPANGELTLHIPNARLWSPDDPFLYDLHVSLTANGKPADHVDSYFGMRKISLGQDHGVQKILLNNKFVFEFGPLDQGFWPDGIYTPPTEDALVADIKSIKGLGFNMVRKHIKVEPDRWYYWTDKLGVLVWQDMPSANSYLPRGAHRPNVDVAAFKSELQTMVQTHWNFPSIIMWVTFNEGQGQADQDTQDIVATVRKLDPSRLVNEASGNDDKGFGDVDDVHSYPEPNCRTVTRPKQALACGEFGGIGLSLPGHIWGDKGHSYTMAGDPPDLLYLYNVFAKMIQSYRDQQGMSAAVYTELTDVENEMNGLYTYDRVPKFDPAKFAAATRFELPLAKLTPVLPTSEAAPQTWKYVAQKPTQGWQTADFDDKDWKTGPGVFGDDLKAVAGTIWKTDNIWLRRHFDAASLKPDDISKLIVRDIHGGQIQAFINGIPISNFRRSEPVYRLHLISAEAKAAIKPGSDNVLAVHAVHANGPQMVDVGIYQRQE